MTFEFDELFAKTNLEKWNQIRQWRNRELVLSDWTQLPDSQVDKNAWANYRQALRDLPAQGGNAEDAVMPVRPGGN